MATSLLDSINTSEAEFRAGENQQVPPVIDSTPPPPAADNVPPPAADNTPPPPAADNVAPAFNEGEYLKNNFGVESLNDIKAKWGNLPTLEAQNKQLSDEIGKYKPAYEDLEKAGEVGKLFVSSIAKGIAPETLAQIYKLKPEELSAEDAWKINERINKPYLTAAEIDAKFESKFLVGEDELDERVKVLKQVELKEESQAARSGIKDYIGKTLNPIASNPAVEQAAAKAKTEQLQTAWQPALPAVANSLKTVTRQLPIQTFGAKAGELTNVDVKYNVPEAQQKAIMDQAYTTAVLKGVVPDAAGLKAIQDYAQRMLWADHGEDIVKGFATDLVSAMTEQFAKVMNNPNLAQSIHQNNLTGDKFTPAEQSVLAAMSKSRR